MPCQRKGCRSHATKFCRRCQDMAARRGEGCRPEDLPPVAHPPPGGHPLSRRSARAAGAVGGASRSEAKASAARANLAAARSAGRLTRAEIDAMTVMELELRASVATDVRARRRWLRRIEARGVTLSAKQRAVLR